MLSVIVTSGSLCPKFRSWNPPLSCQLYLPKMHEQLSFQQKSPLGCWRVPSGYTQNCLDLDSARNFLCPWHLRGLILQMLSQYMQEIRFSAAARTRITFPPTPPSPTTWAPLSISILRRDSELGHVSRMWGTWISLPCNYAKGEECWEGSIHFSYRISF